MVKYGTKMDVNTQSGEQEQILEENQAEPVKISRKPNVYRFRTVEDNELKDHVGPIRFSDIKLETIEWLWYPYIPLGRITMIGGDPGAGKSFISTALAATLSRGDSFPGEEDGIREPMASILLSVEDDPNDTIKPRLRNLKANQHKVYISSKDIILDVAGLSSIRQMVKITKAKLLVIDPIVAFLGAKMDMNRANEVRPLMRGLYHIAKDLNIAVVVIRHNRKVSAGNKEGKAIYAGSGSIDFTASVRSELAVSEARDGSKYMNHIKTNSGKQGPSIRYEIVELADGTGEFRWGEVVTGPLGMSPRIGISKRFKNEKAIKLWLFDLLAQAPEGELAKNIFAKGMLSGYSQTKLEHVKKGIAMSVKVGHEWVWKLDHAARDTLDADEDGVVA